MRRFSSVHMLVWVIGFLVFSLMPSAPSTLAQPAPCPEAYPYDESVGTCVDPETGLPVDPVTGLPIDPGEEEEPVEEEPVDVVPEGDLASFALYHLACDNDFDANAVRDAGGIGPANGCNSFGSPPFTYTFAANGAQIANATLEATDGDYAVLDVPSPIAAGTLTITVSPVAEYTTELISCAISIGDGFGDIVEHSIDGGSATFDTDADQDIECWVYNVSRTVEDPPEDGGEQGDGATDTSEGIIADPPEDVGTDVTISVFDCPAGTVGTDDLITACSPGLTDVLFTLQTETEDVATALSDSSGLVVFDDVVPDTYGIAETLPAGYGEPIVICYQTSTEGIVQEGPRDILFGNQIRFDATVGGFLECSWYNIPATGADDGPNIFIQTRSCGVGVTIPQDLLLADAELLCPDPRPGREFIVRLDGEQVGAAAANSPDGQVFFTKLSVPEGGGSYAVEEILDSREETLRVFCDLGTGDGSFTIVPTTLERNGVIYQSLNAGETLRCSWFSTEAIMSTVPASGGEPRIEVNLRLCDADVDLVNDDLLADCKGILENIVFQIAFEAQLVDEPIPDSNGSFEINTSIGPGTFELKSLPVVGLSDPRYRCLIAPGDGTSEEITGSVPADSPGLALPVEGNEIIFCYFFYQNIAEDQAADDAVDEETEVTPGITVLAKLCPPDTAQLRVDITEYCNYPGPNITFDVAIDGEPFNSQTTGEDGQIDVPIDAGAGTYLIANQPKAGHLGPDVNCLVTHADGSVDEVGTFVDAESPGPEFVFDGSSEVVCIFYFLIVPDELEPEDSAVMDDLVSAPGDVPAEADPATSGGNSLTIQFWTCPNGIDTAAEQTQLLLECTADLDERSLRITSAGGTENAQATGVLNREFAGSSIAVDLEGDLPSSTWCSSSWTENGEEESEFPDSVSLDDGTLTLTVSRPATTIYCDWFFFTE